MTNRKLKVESTKISLDAEERCIVAQICGRIRFDDNFDVIFADTALCNVDAIIGWTLQT